MTDDAVRQTRHALTQITEAWPFLPDAKDAALRRRRPDPRPMGAEARLTLDALVRAERDDRLLAVQRYGRMGALPASPAPVALDVVDAQALTAVTMRDLAWLAANVLRGRGFGWPPITITLHGTRDFLTIAVGHVGPSLARQMADDLVDCARQLRAALDLDVRDDQVWIQLGDERVLFVTAHRAGHHLDGVHATNVRDLHRLGRVVDEDGADRSLLSDRRRWYPLPDVERAAAKVGRDAPEAKSA
ncbi:hypothetical protein GCM10009557_06060 [Virgisporangium ochraceum]